MKNILLKVSLSLLALAPLAAAALGQAQAPAASSPAAAATGAPAPVTAADLQARIASYRQQLKQAVSQGLIDRATSDGLNAALNKLQDKARRADITAGQIAVIGNKLDRLGKRLPSIASSN